jgi:hypothetical protein
VDVTLDGLVAALEGLRLGARRVDVASVSVSADTAGRVTFRGFAPTAVSLDLRGLALEGLRLAPATDDAPE